MSQPLIMSFRQDAAAMCLDDRKSMTRRILGEDMSGVWAAPAGAKIIGYGRDRMVVVAKELALRPSWKLTEIQRPGRALWTVGKSIAIKPKRTACAIGRVMCTGLRVEHVQDITEEDARREGITEASTDPRWFRGWANGNGNAYSTARDAFAAVWRRLNPRGPTSWDANPLVVVIEFRPIAAGEV